MRAAVLLFCLLLPTAARGQAGPLPGFHYPAGARADRIVLSPGDDPARSMAVA